MGGWFFKSSHQGSILAWLNARTAHIETDLTRPRAYLSAAHYPRRNSITGAAVDSIFANTCTSALPSPFASPSLPFLAFYFHQSRLTTLTMIVRIRILFKKMKIRRVFFLVFLGRDSSIGILSIRGK